jgi:hypothetical protein
MYEYDNHVCLDWSVLITLPTGTDQALCSHRFAQSPFYLLTFLNFKIKMKKKKLFLKKKIMSKKFKFLFFLVE